MKSNHCFLRVALLTLALSLLMSSMALAENPGTPPPDVLAPSGNAPAASQSVLGNGALIENAVSVRIDEDGQTEYMLHMYDNAAVATMMDYLSSEASLFPTFVYDAEVGYVEHNIQGSYTRDADVTVTDVHAGELYLFGDGLLRLYVKDVPGANITATPAGFFADPPEDLATLVDDAHVSNIGDVWGVNVYFWITRLV